MAEGKENMAAEEVGQKTAESQEQEPVVAEAAKPGKKKLLVSGVKSVLGGGVLGSDRVMRQIPFIFFLVFLSLVMITNRYWSEQTIREIEMVKDSIRQLSAEAVTHEAKLMGINRPSEVARRVQENGLELMEPEHPAQRIVVKKLEE
jgi:hypothetical protein